VAVAAGIDPLLVLVPCGIGFSWAFMMPMGTPPNAIVFGSGRVTIRQMAWAGLWFNVTGIVILIVASRTVIPWVLPGLG
jgi:sodium-dependent dicarboxylate transporter 2/3/5